MLVSLIDPIAVVPSARDIVHDLGFFNDNPLNRVLTAETWPFVVDVLVGLRSGDDEDGDELCPLLCPLLALLSLLDDADRARVSFSTSSRLTFSCE